MPSGTVTFLFTDIESSSSLWEAEPVAMRGAVARHDELVREAVEASGGVVFKQLGDGLCAAFPTAPDGLAAAVAAQQALSEEEWPAGIRLRARMGLHSGAGAPVGEDYLGPAVNRVARVMSAGNAGQIVCSAATAALCPDAELRDAGLHLLAGVGSERLFVRAFGDGDARPLRSAVTAPTNLAAEASSFVGRSAEVKELGALLGSHRLVSLVGPGGIGKTRLAVETAAEVAALFGDGVWFCDLAAVATGEQVPGVVADTLGARQQPGMDLVESIALFLERRRCLVILDNCEHVLEAAARLARRLVEVDGTVVLVTSRELFGVRGEQVFPVAALDSAGVAAELFMDRARERDPRFELDEDGEAAVIEICRRLDGMPLAIELAAARTGALAPRAIARRLDDRFRLLRGGRRGERHQTLRDTVQWSFELLSEPEATLFERLAVFAGGFTLGAVEAVCADGEVVAEGDVLDLLASLVDKSMVQRERGSDERFTLLETLRQFAEERLDAGAGAGQWRECHAAHFAALVADNDRQFFSPAELEAWHFFEAEWDNIRAAFNHAEAVGDIERAARVVSGTLLYSLYAMRYELGDWARLLLDRSDLPDDPTIWRVHAVLAWLACHTGDHIAAVRACDTAATLGRIDPGYWFSCFPAYVRLADTAGISRFAKALLEAANEPRGDFGAAIVQTFDVRAIIEQPDHGVVWATRVQEIATTAGFPTGCANAQHVRGVALRNVDPPAACAAFRLTIDLASSIDRDHLLIDAGLDGLAQAAAFGGPIGDALVACRDAIESAARYRYITSLTVGLQYGAIAIARAGRPHLAADLLDCVHDEGHRVHGNVASSVAAAADVADAGPADIETSRPPRSLLDAADITLAALDVALESMRGAST